MELGSGACRGVDEAGSPAVGTMAARRRELGSEVAAACSRRSWRKARDLVARLRELDPEEPTLVRLAHVLQELDS